MLTFRGAAAGALTLASAGLIAVAPAADAQPAPDGVTITADLKLNRDGVLEVSEKVTVPPDGEFRMSIPLRLKLAGDTERVFTVTDVDTKGTGTATIADDQFTIEAKPGESEFTFAVHNTVGAAPNTQIFRWLGVLNADIAALSLAMISPSYAIAIQDCTLGPPGNTRPCSDIRTEADGTLYLEETNLHKGDSIDLTLQLPPGTVPANADIRGDDQSPFAITAPVLVAFGALLLALAGMVGFVLRARRENATAAASTDTIDPLLNDGKQVHFTSPDGILPGAAGVLMDEYVDPRDIAATVVDLAVRRYLWITPIGDTDWRIERMNPADDQLRDYEKAVYRALLPDGTDSVTITELRAVDRVPAGPIRTAMLADAVERGAFGNRNRIGLPTLVGGALIVTGVVATIALALTSGHALVGVAILLAGIATLLLPRFLPVRTIEGAELVGRIRALQRGLEVIQRNQIPSADQELVFSRALPFMIVGGRTDSWVRNFRDLNPAADSNPGLYWFGTFERDRNLQRFAGHFPFFITALEGLFAGVGDH